MKLNDIVRHLSFLDDVRIYTRDGGDEDPVFEGGVLDIPWIYLDMELDTTADYEAIGLSSFSNMHGVFCLRFDISLKESGQ